MDDGVRVLLLEHLIPGLRGGDVPNDQPCPRVQRSGAFPGLVNLRVQIVEHNDLVGAVQQG